MWMPRGTLVPYGLRDIVDKFLPEDEVEKFAAWAFGENYGDFLQIIDFAQAWNQLHGELFYIDVSTSIVDDVYKMTTYFKKGNTDGQCGTREPKADI